MREDGHKKFKKSFRAVNHNKPCDFWLFYHVRSSDSNITITERNTRTYNLQT